MTKPILILTVPDPKPLIFEPEMVEYTSAFEVFLKDNNETLSEIGKEYHILIYGSESIDIPDVKIINQPSLTDIQFEAIKQSIVDMVKQVG